RVKTDRRDSESLARLHRAGELTAVWVPGPEQEAVRDLTRAREDTKALERQAKQRLSALSLAMAASMPQVRPSGPRPMGSGS
uniref:IS110 family transposase n=1 Tax=Acidiferrobacter sp. TaxID=1872107 RepID=UPI00261A3DE4